MTDLSKSLLAPDATIRTAMLAIEANESKISLIVNNDGCLLGTVTDGDIRRGLLKGVSLDETVDNVMNSNPKTSPPSENTAHLLAYMRRESLRHMPIIDANGVLVGVQTLADLLEIERRDNWVVLMAGGEGRRLRPLTEDIPKPMLPVGLKPILETIIDSYIEAGFRKFFLSVNYKAELIEKHFGDGSSRGIEITYIHEDTPLGTAGALSLLPERPDLPIFVMNGDILTNVSFTAALDFHKDHNSKATMCVRDYHFQVPYGVIKADGHKLMTIDEKPEHHYFVNAGIYILEPEVIDLVPKGEAFTMPQLFDAIKDQGKACSVFPISEYWLDIGRSDDLEKAKLEISDVFHD